jgi:putative nucleotidyltransferase with HDIG domain
MPTAESLISQYSSLKTLPHVAVRVAEMVNSQESTMQDFEEVIRLDPVLVTRLLRLVNSPYFGLVNKVESISKAVVYIGMKNLRNLVAVEALRQLFTGSRGEGFSRRDLWLHSATVSILAEMIAVRIFGREGENFFLAGIIHDIGLIVEDQLQSKQLLEACRNHRPGEKSLIICEQEAMGTDHCRVGVALAREWKLPGEIIEAIRNHHDSEKKFQVDSVTSVLQLAEYFACRLNYAVIPGSFDKLSPHLERHVRTMMASYRIIVRDLPQEMAKANDLYEAEDPA